MDTGSAATDVRERYVGEGRERLYVRDAGDGPAVVVLHGGPDFDHRYLLPDTDRLATDFRVVHYDQRGRGRSFSPDATDDVSIATEVADLDRVRAELGLETVAVMGHSWGALLAMEYAIRHPRRVSHLVLLHSAPPSHAAFDAFRTTLEHCRAPADAERLAAMRADPAYRNGDPDADTAYYRIHYRPFLPRPDLVERLLATLRFASPEHLLLARAIEERLYEQTARSPEWDLLPRLAEVDAPALVVHGALDAVPVAQSVAIAEAMPRGRCAVLPECGHFSYLEQPAAWHALVREFLLGPAGAASGPTGT